VFGTENYRAPEFEIFESFGYNSDVWSLGKVLLYLSTGVKSQDIEELLCCCLVEDKNLRPQVHELLTIPSI
jgi:hypothetical protein